MLNRSLTAALLAGALAVAQGAHAGELTLFSGAQFSGGQMSFTGAAQDLSRLGFNDRASSVVVRSGRWQVCEHANFEGQCEYLERGEYPDLRRLRDRISSLREVDERRDIRVGRERGWGGDQRGGGDGWRDDDRYEDRRDDRRNRGPAIEMYRKAEFRSDRRDFNDAVLRDFNVIGFNDRTQSMVIRYGQWEFCEHVDFGGNCEVYGPGRYPHLGHMSSRISSVRRVR